MENKEVLQSEQPILVLLVEDHPMVRDGITPIIQSLSDNVQLLFAEDLKSAKAILKDNPDLNLVLMDLFLPDGNGLDLLELISDAAVRLPVAVISATDDVEIIEDAFAKGVKGYITKDTKPELIVHALHLVLAGGIYVPPQLVGRSRSHSDTGFLGVSPEQKVRSLTSRQMEVFKLLVAGRTNREIATELSCAEATVKAHITAVLKTLGVANRSAAIETVDSWPWLRNFMGVSSEPAA